MKKHILDGETYYSIGDAAKYLGTNAVKIRAMMGKELDYAQKGRSRTFLISAASLTKLKYAQDK